MLELDFITELATNIYKETIAGIYLVVVTLGYVKKDRSLSAEKKSHMKTIEESHSREMDTVRESMKIIDEYSKAMDQIVNLLERKINGNGKGA